MLWKLAAAIHLSVIMHASARASEAGLKSISQWAVCDGKTDDSKAVAAAFAAAKNGAFTLVVDCPAFVRVGMDIARPIFIDDGTSVQFAPGGLFIVDNVMVPTWVIANSSNITLTGWIVEYVGGMPVNPVSGGYFNNGVWVLAAGPYQPSSNWNNALTKWLSANRGIVFQKSGAQWPGPTGTSAIFYLIGDSGNITITNMRLFVPSNALGSQFIPTAFSSNANWLSNQTVTATTPVNDTTSAVPYNVKVSNLVIDGAYMGWVGPLENSKFDQVTSFRYGDLQDASGGNVGGVGRWFAPPHLFYLTSYADDVGLGISEVTVSNVMDYGCRVGVARDNAANSPPYSGYASSLKMGGIDSLVKNYTSYRPDGPLTVLPSDNFTITGLRGYYNSAFTSNFYNGITFPMNPYTDVQITDTYLVDVAQVSVEKPIANMTHPTSTGMVLKATVVMNSWGSPTSYQPTFAGSNPVVDINFVVHPVHMPVGRCHKACCKLRPWTISGQGRTSHGFPAALRPSSPPRVRE